MSGRQDRRSGRRRNGCQAVASALNEYCFDILLPRPLEDARDNRGNRRCALQLGASTASLLRLRGALGDPCNIGRPNSPKHVNSSAVVALDPHLRFEPWKF